MVNSFANIRKDYLKNALDEKQIHKDPLLQFHQWLSDAINSGVEEPTAMVLSTVSEKGFPSSRMVLLKDADENLFKLINRQWSVIWLDGLMQLLREPATWVPVYIFLLFWFYKNNREQFLLIFFLVY